MKVALSQMWRPLFVAGHLMIQLGLADAIGSTRKMAKETSEYKLPDPHELQVNKLENVVEAFKSFPGRMYAGSLPMDHESFTPGRNPENKRTGFLQFWLFIPDEIAAEGTMVSWFNGGPGCSSFSAGIMFETSPVTVPLNEAGWCCEKQDEPLLYNRYAWTNASVMLYVEQPIGVGFSEATNDTPEPFSEDDVAADFDAFLQNFYKVFDGFEHRDGKESKYDPKLDMTNHKLFLVGESYAGVYIPSVARGIYLNNVKNLPNIDGSERFQTPLAGVAIGNGKIDSLTQDPAVINFAYWHGLIDMPTRDFLYAEWDHCMANYKLGKVGKHVEPAPFHPFNLRDDCGVFVGVLNAAGAGAFEKLMAGPNIYEYSTWDAYEAADGEDGTVSRFYNNLKVQEALNVPPHRRGPKHLWQGCIPEPDPADYRRRLSSSESSDLLAVLGDNKTSTSMMGHRRLFMDNDTPLSVLPYIAELLDEAKIDVLLYSGDRDIICCTQGSEEAIRKMDWSGTREAAPSNNEVSSNRNAWTEAPRGLWLYEDYPAGYIKKHKNLGFLTIYNAGHMVPYNQPGPALDMLTRFLKGESFYDRPLVSFASSLMPEEVSGVTSLTEKGNVKENQKENLMKELHQSAFSSDASLVDGSGLPKMSGPGFNMMSVVGMVVLAASTAFILGIWIARSTMAPSQLSSTEVKPLKEDDYGSI
mmetsp:Transcript_5224/g.9273  ORF Transcript_5224/g.9273 Transcript_5224/m.9273 type:complete len:697 (+) Transcript_5224:32-2122(+)